MRRLGVALLVTGFLSSAPAIAADAQKADAPPKEEAAPVAPSAPAEATPAPAAPAPAAPAPAAPAPAPSGGPPTYYVEPQPPRSHFGYEAQPYEPPPPPLAYYEPPPPPPRRLPRKAPPRTAFWIGARAAWFIPFGSVWLDGADYGGGLFFRRRSFADYASPGPSGELDVGARLGRRYNLFGLWEHATLGTGSLDDKAFGGQARGSTNLYGVGLRFSTDPADVGFLMEIALGVRDFHAHWDDGTTLALTDAFDARVGIGADVRINRCFALSPMLVLGGGSFNRGHWSGPAGSQGAFDTLDQPGQYGTLKLEVGAHFDVR
jgi:hypothetical protein